MFKKTETIRGQDGGFIILLYLPLLYNKHDGAARWRPVLLCMSQWHKGLLKKLRAIKVRGGMLDIITSYLQGRRARTTVEGEFSHFVNIDAGVPQGSRLGPILFIIYLNDLIHDLESLPLIYADDTTLISSEVDTHKTTS